MRTIHPETLALLRESFENPHQASSRKWHTHERLVREAARKISDLPQMPKAFERARIFSILSELEDHLEKLSPKPPKAIPA